MAQDQLVIVLILHHLFDYCVMFRSQMQYLFRMSRSLCCKYYCTETYLFVYCMIIFLFEISPTSVLFLKKYRSFTITGKVH